MEHAGFHSGEGLIVEPFTATVSEYSLGERKRRAGCATRLLQASRLPFIRESSHPRGMSHLRHRYYSKDDPRTPISHSSGLPASLPLIKVVWFLRGGS